MEKALPNPAPRLPRLSGQAKVDANKHADEIEAKLSKAQAEQSQKISAVSADVSEVKM